MTNKRFLTQVEGINRSSDLYCRGLKFPSQKDIKHTPLVFINSHPTVAKVKPRSFDYNSINIDTSKAMILNGDTVELVANWFLHMSSLSNKKLQKLCYYAYCWYIVFNNDIEDIEASSISTIKTLFPESFQAWIHGPVLPKLYHKYKRYGWHNIPKENKKVKIQSDVEELLEQVWDAYGEFSGDELELISHKETPWVKARKSCSIDDACYNEISKKDILEYYSSLGR